MRPSLRDSLKILCPILLVLWLPADVPCAAQITGYDGASFGIQQSEEESGESERDEAVLAESPAREAPETVSPEADAPESDLPAAEPSASEGPSGATSSQPPAEPAEPQDNADQDQTSVKSEVDDEDGEAGPLELSDDLLSASAEPTSILEEEVLIKPPRLTAPISVEYPAAAMRRRRRPRAVVVLALYVDDKGRVVRSLVREGAGSDLGFDEAAVAAAKGFRFSPATEDGSPVSAWTQLAVDFTPP